MKPGALLFHRRFLFKDGKRDDKIIVLLNDGTSGYFLATKTTSQSRNKTATFGCNLRDRYPNYFLPRRQTCLSMNTWVCLDDYHELDGPSLDSGRVAGEVNIIGHLEDQVTRCLLDCACASFDISAFQQRVVEEIIERYFPINTGSTPP